MKKITKEYRQAYYRKNLQKWRKYKTDYNHANPEKVLFQSAKGRAKHKGLEFSITITDITIPERCPVLNILLVSHGTGGNWAAWDAPSLDRIDPRQGYVPGNVRVISWRANSLKRDGSLEEMRLVLADLERLQDR